MALIMKIEQVLHDGASQRGRAKVLSLINRSGWITLTFSGTDRLKGFGIGHRVSWERLQSYIRAFRSRVIGQMRSTSSSTFRT